MHEWHGQKSTTGLWRKMVAMAIVNHGTLFERPLAALSSEITFSSPLFPGHKVPIVFFSHRRSG
ncbi:hypothetical protein ETA_33560 [Erwinia tasmaniensis Et1/99]|uniref:Uncharacterized protein n=1 Tax=Erwinia tasmaniensis (strain DSM 17950 / CFBP 7177 / CIP 109463 / NCPPB 4357 / Et1/99) TaxID=465817 RepID=B2VJJ5_ERWT9|nr:hypothetical protein ETA_33560 [Erwinia tasmaniensis Et1/99]